MRPLPFVLIVLVGLPASAFAQAETPKIDLLPLSTQLQIRQNCELYARQQAREAAPMDRETTLFGANLGCISAQTDKALRQAPHTAPLRAPPHRT